MAEAPELIRKRWRYRLAVSIISVASVFGPMGCSLFDWDDGDMPAGYRASPPLAKQAKQTASARAEAYLQDNRLGLAIDAYLTALVVEGRTIETLNGLGVAYDLLGRFDLSRQYYREALAIDSRSVRTLNNLGRSYALDQNYIEAIRYYELAMAFDPSNAIVLSNLAEARTFAHRPPRMTADASAPDAGRSGEPRLPWVQFAGPDVQTLVTQADASLIESLRKTDVKPQLAAPALLVLEDGKPGGAVPTVSPARHASVAPDAADAAGAGLPVAMKAAMREVAGKVAAYVPVTIKAPASAPADTAKVDPSPVGDEPAAPATTSVTRGAGRYRVQLAAMRTNDEAERARQTLRVAQNDILDRLELTIERADLGPERGVFYRIQTSPVGAEEEAKSLCRSFTQRRQNCFVVRT